MVLKLARNPNLVSINWNLLINWIIRCSILGSRWNCLSPSLKKYYCLDFNDDIYLDCTFIMFIMPTDTKYVCILTCF